MTEKGGADFLRLRAFFTELGKFRSHTTLKVDFFKFTARSRTCLGHFATKRWEAKQCEDDLYYRSMVSLQLYRLRFLPSSALVKAFLSITTPVRQIELK
jgi:hypothetical protein